jgi:phospholipid/cholesterol/gamma-HCH transport system permease protein
MMNAIALLGQRVIERVNGIGVATLMLLRILCSIPTALGVKLSIKCIGLGCCPY